MKKAHGVSREPCPTPQGAGAHRAKDQMLWS